MQRRTLIQAGASALLAGCAGFKRAVPARVVVVGGGWGGSTAAKYCRILSQHQLDVTLIEPAGQFVSCPLSNLVLGGTLQMADISHSYDALVQQHGVQWRKSRASRIDVAARQVLLEDGSQLGYERLILSPGVDFVPDSVQGLAGHQDQVLHAWKAGPQTLALRQQLQAMRQGGVFVLSVPLLPYRCPPAPFERACQVAAYLQRSNTRAKVMILDANSDISVKGDLFRQAFATRYPGMIEYRPDFQVNELDWAGRQVVSEFGDKVGFDVLNLIPPQRAASIAMQHGLANINQRWCEVDFLSYESTRVKNVHVLGDAIFGAPLMPKSGHMASQQGQVCAAAAVQLLSGMAVNRSPLLNSSCYSFVAPDEAIHIASRHRYDAQQQTMLVLPGSGAGSGTVSGAASRDQAQAAHGWAREMWVTMLA